MNGRCDNGLYMSDFEIYRSYRTAKHPNRQIEVLAALNGTTSDRIKAAIRRQEKAESKIFREIKKAKDSINPDSIPLQKGCLVPPRDSERKWGA